MNIQTNTEVQLKDFESIIITALEGGSNYWYLLKDSHLGLGKNNPEKTLTERISYKLFTDPEYKLTVHDYEHPNDKLGEVTQTSILEALEKFPKLASKIFEEEYDADDADILFQYATMREVVFG